MLKKIIALIICLFLLINIGFANTFNDITNHWARNDILSLANDGLVSGYENNTFRPSQNIKRDEFIVLVMRLIRNELGDEQLDQLIDQSLNKSQLLPWEKEYDKVYDILQLPNYWGKKVVLEAVNLRLLPYEYNIYPFVSYYSFRADISRGEAAYIMNKAAELIGIEADRMLHNYILEEITDINDSHPYSISALDAYAIGLLSGYDDNTLRPDKNLTRAESVAMLIKFHDLSRLTSYEPENTPFVYLYNVYGYKKPMKYYPPLVNGKMNLDALNLVKTLQDNLELSDGYLQFLYNPENMVLTLEFYNDREDFLSLQNSPDERTYVSRLAQTLYMTFTINPSNIDNYSKTTRLNKTYSKYNPYQLISWGNGFESDLLNNHYEYLEAILEHLFGNSKEYLLDRMEHYLLEGEGGLTTYQEYGERYASWKPLGDGIFIMEIMEVDYE
ncbi:MAG: S-layer homology domain-containing protein [Clostridia bacterium]